MLAVWGGGVLRIQGEGFGVLNYYAFDSCLSSFQWRWKHVFTVVLKKQERAINITTVVTPEVPNNTFEPTHITNFVSRSPSDEPETPVHNPAFEEQMLVAREIMRAHAAVLRELARHDSNSVPQTT